MSNFDSMTSVAFTSVLVIGSTGRLGLNLLRNLAAHPCKPSVHAFTRSASKLSKRDRALCDTVVEGDARKSSDVKRALLTTGANIVIMSIGEGDSTKPTDIRTATAEALANVLNENPAFDDVRVVIVSTVGAGGSKIKLGFGLGRGITFMLRHVIEDHNGQEAAFMEDDSLRRKTLVVRGSALTDGKAKGGVVTFGDRDKTPSGHVDRADLALWIVEEICDDDARFGRAVNVTGK